VNAIDIVDDGEDSEEEKHMIAAFKLEMTVK
jgi:hypothetical protein